MEFLHQQRNLELPLRLLNQKLCGDQFCYEKKIIRTGHHLLFNFQLQLYLNLEIYYKTTLRLAYS